MRSKNTNKSEARNRTAQETAFSFIRVPFCPRSQTSSGPGEQKTQTHMYSPRSPLLVCGGAGALPHCCWALPDIMQWEPTVKKHYINLIEKNILRSAPTTRKSGQSLTLLEPQSRSGGIPLEFQVFKTLSPKRDWGSKHSYIQ